MWEPRLGWETDNYKLLSWVSICRADSSLKDVHVLYCDGAATRVQKHFRLMCEVQRIDWLCLVGRAAKAEQND